MLNPHPPSMNKSLFLLAAVCVSLNAQETKAPKASAESAPLKIEAAKVEVAAKAEPKVFVAEIWLGKNIVECLTFQKNEQVLGQQIEELKRLNNFLENALTTPEREARSHEIAAKQAKFKGDNESMGKLYNGYSFDRPHQLVPTKAVIATPISNEEFTKLSGAKDFKTDSIIAVGEKKYQIRSTVAGQVEVETFGISLRGIVEGKNKLQQLIDLQPKLTKDDDKKKVDKLLKDVQDELNKNLEEFKKTQGFDFTSEAITLPYEAKLVVQISEDEKKALEAKNASAAPVGPEKK